MSARRTPPTLLVSLLACAGAVGCQPGRFEPPDLGPLPDTGAVVDAFVPQNCQRDDECDDGIPCTRDRCDDRGQCVFSADALACDDGVFCNGAEVCEPAFGCVPGPLRDCSDGDVCTLDRCDEDLRRCVHEPRDFDGDGEADWHCAGGTDCDDTDPERGSLLAELCQDSVDNDCDSLTDESQCGRPPFDVCEDALDVSGGGLFIVPTAGARDDYGAACEGSPREVVARFDLLERADVRVTATGEGSTSVVLRGVCADPGTELGCAAGAPGEVRLRDADPGQYVALIGDDGVQVNLDVALTAPTTQPLNETCDTAGAFALPLSVSNNFVGIADDVELACGEAGAPDLVYRVTVPGNSPTDTMDVVVGAASPSGEAMRFELRTNCGDPLSLLGCTRGSPAGARFRPVPPGEYFVLVEGPAARQVDFSLQVQLEPATTAPPGDDCAAPIDTPLDTDVVGTLSDKGDSVETSCGFFYRDAVHRFVLDEPRDVQIQLAAGDQGNGFIQASVRDVCADGDSQLRCVAGSPVDSTLFNLGAGEHFVVIEAFGAPSYQLRIETSEPTVATPVAGNDVCDDAIPIPASGTSVFSGTTEGLINDYDGAFCGGGARSPDAAFVLELTEDRLVRASTAGSAYDTVLVLFNMNGCDGFVWTCNDDFGGPTSQIERVLTAGTWWFVVDGFGASSSGDYVLQVDVAPPQ